MASLLQKAEKFIQLHIEEAPEAFSKKKRTLYERLEEIQARFYEKEYAKPVQFDEETFELPIPGEEPNLQNEKDPFDDWEKEALEEQGFEEKKSELSTREISSPDSEEKFVSTSHPQDNELEEDKQRQIEEYLALIEISKEIIKSGSFEEYFENIMYGILGQYGVDSFMLFSNLNLEEDYQLIKQDGLEEEISFKLKYQGKLKHLLTEQKGIIEFQTLSSSSIDESEFSFMKETNTRIIIPLFSNEKLFCIILMGEMISGDDYTGSDFEIIEIFCEFAGNFFNNVSEYEQKNKTLENLTDLARSSLETFTLTDKFTFCNKLEDAYDIISGYLSSVLEIKRLTIILNTGNFETSYKIVYTNQFQEKTSEKFILDSSDSEFLEKLQKGIDLYEFSISEQDEFVAQIPDDEISHVKDFKVFPLINSGWLLGFIALHDLGENWSSLKKDKILHLSGVIAATLASLILQQEKSEYMSNPFGLIEGFIDKQIKIASVRSTQFSLLVVKIQNSGRIINLLGMDFYNEYNRKLWEIIHSNIGSKDILVRIGIGKYATILSDTGKKDAEMFINRIKTGALSIDNARSKGFNISIQIYLLIYPEQTTDKRKFLEMLEET